MVSSKSENNTIRVSVKNTTNVTKANASSINSSNPVNASNNQAKMYEQQALAHANTSKYWAEQSETSALKSETYTNSLLKNEDFIAVSGNLETIVEIGQTLKEVDVEKIVNAEQNTVENATIATTQATIATEQASNASVSATNASNSELNAKTSETNAQTSSNNANSYMQQAKTYSETAREQSNIAIENAEISTTQASNSLESAKQAKTSETNALTYSNSALASANVATQQANIAKEQAQIAKDEVAKLSTVYKYKGSVATINNLPTNANVGDVYDTQETGMNYAWNGTEWDELGGTFDVSWGSLKGSISDNADLQTALNSKVGISNAETITGKKTFTGSPIFQANNYETLIVKRNNASAGALITYSNTGGVLGRMGVNGLAVPIFIDPNGSDIRAIVRGGEQTNPQIGSNETPIYINSNGIATASTVKFAKLTDIPDVTNFITMADVESKGYLTEVPSEYITETELSSFAYDKATVDGKIAEAVTGGTVDLSGYAKDSEVVHLANSETITGAKTFTGAVNLIGSGDSNAVGISTNTRFNVHNTNKTVLGFGNNLFYINHGDYRLRLRGKDTRPHYNSDTNYLALLSDIPDVSNLATKSEIPTDYATKTELEQGLATKQPTGDYALSSDIVTYTAGENITIENGVISASGGAEIDTSNLATKSDVANKQDRFETSLPLEMGGLKTSTDNISADINGKDYLNTNAYYATLSDYLPSDAGSVGSARDEVVNFEDVNIDNAVPNIHFSKVTGVNGEYPKLNLEGYNSIIRKFEVGDIICGDVRTNWDGSFKHRQMVLGELSNDGTFVPKLETKIMTWDYGALAYISLLKTPTNYYKYGQKEGGSTYWVMEYFTNESYTNVATVSGDVAKNFVGIKFVERSGAVGVNWVNEDDTEYELTNSTTFNLDELGINCVIYGDWVIPDNRENVGHFGFDKNKYFVAKDTIDNVVVRLTDGTGKDSLNLKYSDDFILNENNELKLKNAIPDVSNFATKEEVETLQNEIEDKPSITAVNNLFKILENDIANLENEISNQDIGLRKLVEVSDSSLMPSWYKVFEEIQPDGSIKKWCEQGGVITPTSTGKKTYNFAKEFSDENYSLFKQYLRDTSATDSASQRLMAIAKIGTTSFSNYDVSGTSFSWQAKGFIN